MFRTTSFILFLLAIVSFPGHAMSQERDALRMIEWPSREFPTIQSAIDALADGGKLKIAPGVYDVDEPIIVAGKRVIIQGAGCSVHKPRGEPNQRQPVTELIGPLPDRLVNADGPLGIFNFVAGGSGEVRDVLLRGADAGIVGDDSEGRSGPLRVKDVCITDTGRGILWLCSTKLEVLDSEISNSKHGITVTPKLTNVVLGDGLSFYEDDLPKVIVFNNFIHDIDNVGYFCIGSKCEIEKTLIASCQEGAIVAIDSTVVVTGCYLVNNTFAGVALFECTAAISDTYIVSVFARKVGEESEFGDGVICVLCPFVGLASNIIHTCDDAGVLNIGSYVVLLKNQILCTKYDLVEYDVAAGAFGPGLPPQEVKASYDDYGKNICGCPPDALRECNSISAGIAPPSLIEP